MSDASTQYSFLDVNDDDLRAVDAATHAQPLPPSLLAARMESIRAALSVRNTTSTAPAVPRALTPGQNGAKYLAAQEDTRVEDLAAQEDTTSEVSSTLSSASSPTLEDRIVDYVFDKEDASTGFAIADIVKAFKMHATPEVIEQIVDGLIERDMFEIAGDDTHVRISKLEERWATVA
ncbi:hypothetical protein MKEN_00390800 [Mycena kentingensis (nom. inval.)]|nr:hypothetical protein MKEN_00390800 [Mycena kentingensis (nom. inval.)]